MIKSYAIDVLLFVIRVLQRTTHFLLDVVDGLLHD